MIPVSNRLKDVLWSLRHRFGLEADIDRIFPYIVFNRNLTLAQVEDLFIVYPKRIPEDFKSTLLARIRMTVIRYWQYKQTKQGYHKILEAILFLENVARFGFEGCYLSHSDIKGYQLELKK